MSFKFTPEQRRCIDALRGDKYRQGTGWTTRGAGEEACFCPLGVFMMEVAGRIELHNTIVRGKAILTGPYAPTDEFADRLGLFSPYGAASHQMHPNSGKRLLSIVRMNDDGFSFRQIADHLDRYPEFYFRQSAA